MGKIKIGKVTHYYDKIGVAVIELSDKIAKGDRIKFVRGGEDLFEQTIDSIQVEHQEIESAKAGDTIGLKTDGEVRNGAEVYKV